ncbi:MAG: MerR family transcriptional regulator [Actinomycetota bacterium]|nr:MerR family transcriptional regulator [Actinomycetota bacterium]
MNESARSIGAVVDELLPEFPDLTISKIRFLEAEGLITPERATSGYRRYRRDDVARLRYVLVAQRDRFWPLKVIREALDALDRGLEPSHDGGVVGAPDGSPGSGVDEVSGTPGLPSVPSPDPGEGLPPQGDLRAPRRLRLTETEIRTASGLDVDTFASLVTYGLLRQGADGHYDAAALEIARSAGALAGVGIEARHLRPFRTAADREIGLVRQAVRPGDDEETARVLRHCLALHVALVKAGLGS